MSQITGVLAVENGGKTYQLCLGMRGLGQLQQEYGQQLAPITQLDPEKDELPDFGVIVRVVEIALERFHPDADQWLADDLCRQDLTIVFKLLEAAMPDMADQPAPGGKGKAKKARARG